MPLFMKEWLAFTDQIYILDDGSTDRSIEIAKDYLPTVQVRRRESTEWDAVAVDDACVNWSRELDGWVLIPPCDEFLLEEPDVFLRQLSSLGEDVQAVLTDSYYIYEEEGQQYDPERPLREQYRRGTKAIDNRIIVRDKQAVVFSPGRHGWSAVRMPAERVKMGDFIAAPKRLAFDRRLICASRLGEHDKAKGMGIEKLNWTLEIMEAKWKEGLAQSIEL